MENDRIKVYCRQRPILANEISQTENQSSSCDMVAGGSCMYYGDRINQEFTFDRCFSGGSSNQDIYESCIKGFVDSALEGYSVAIMAYGRTGTGKTYTLRGDNTAKSTQGLMYQCIEELLKSNTLEIWASYVQVYCEELIDLLAPGNQLTLRDSSERVSIEGLSRIRISCLDDFELVMSRGEVNRCTAATNANETSSRSHALLIIHLRREVQVSNSDSSKCIESDFVLVDLAGSERNYDIKPRNYARGNESKYINLSLSALGNCVNALAEKRKHIPFRDSKLTRILQSSLNGSSKVALLVTITSDKDSSGDTLNTLRFAARASSVAVQARVARYVDYEVLYNQAQQEVDKLISENQELIRQSQSYQDKLEKQESTIQELQLKLDSSTAQLEELSRLHIRDSHGPQSAANDNDGQDDTEEVVKKLTEKFDNQIRTLTKSYERKIQDAKEKISEGQREASCLQLDLQQERASHLTTLQDMRALQEKHITLENEFHDRIQELMNDLQSERDKNEDLQAKLEVTTYQNKIAENTIGDQQQSMSLMVSKAQVTEMERLFLETVQRLSSRVQDLEATQGRQGRRQGIATTSTSRDDIDQMEYPAMQLDYSEDVMEDGILSTIGGGNNSSGNGLGRARMEPGGRIRVSHSGSSLPNLANHRNNEQERRNGRGSRNLK